MTPELLEPLLDPDSQFHRRVTEYLRQRASASYEKTSSRHPVWRNIERSRNMFIDPDELDQTGSLKNPFDKRHQIVVPHTYAILETVGTFLWSSWTARSPLVPISGRAPEDVVPARLMSMVLDYQVEETQGLLTLYAWFMDALAMGLGVAKNRWVTKEAARWKGKGTERVREEVQCFEGNELSLIDIFRWMWDPNFPVGEFQRGNFVGWHYDIDRMEARTRAKAENWQNFERVMDTTVNTEDRWVADGRSASDRNRSLGVSDPLTTANWGMNSDSTPTGNKSTPLIMTEFFLKMLPFEWRDIAKESGVSEEGLKRYFEGEKIEHWMITMGQGKLLVDIEPTDLKAFPMFVLESHPDKKSILNPGLGELLAGPQNLLNWFWNSDVENSMQGINDSLVYDPIMVEEQDILDPMPGKRVRLTEEGSAAASTRGIANMVTQLKWNAVTTDNVQKMSVLADMMERAASTSDTVQGVVSPGRPSATEISTAGRQAMNRLQKMAELFSIQGVYPWFKRMVQTTQENMTEEQWMKITGEMEGVITTELQHMGGGAAGGFQAGASGNLQRVGRQVFAKIGPDHIAGNFDFPVMNGAPQPDDSSMAGILQQLLQTVASNEVLMQTVDVRELFKQIMLALRVKNVEDFVLKPDQGIAAAEQAGNLVPVGGAQVPPGAAGAGA